MTFQPAFAPLLLAALAAVIAALVLLRRRTATPRRPGLMVAAALLLLAATRPVFGDSEPAVTRIAGDRDPSVFLLVDRSTDTATVRSDVDAVIDRYPGARFSLIGFDAGATLNWPLSADSWSLRPTLDAVTAGPSGTDVEVNAGAASNVLRYQLISAVQQYPRAQNLVFYFGSGAPESTAPQRDFRIPEDSVDGGAVIGYGDAGADRLRAVADQIGVPYLPRTQQLALEDVAPEQQQRASETASAATGFELYWVPAGIAGLLILVELYHALGQLRRTRLDRIEVGR